MSLTRPRSMGTFGASRALLGKSAIYFYCSIGSRSGEISNFVIVFGLIILNLINNN